MSKKCWKLRKIVIKLVSNEMWYGGSWVTGVPPGLQNQCGALGASRVGSIPTCLRQKEKSSRCIRSPTEKSREAVVPEDALRRM